MQIRITALVTALIAMSLLVACATKITPTTLPPGALNTLDAQAYVDLMGAQSALNAVKADYAAGKLPQNAVTKQALNAAIAAYNTAEASWQAYHAGKSNDIAGMQAAVTAAVQAVASLITLVSKGGV
jgi:hypothetical protein